MTTAATIRTNDSCHWYTVSGEPCYELAKKDGTGMKSPTLADARKLQLLPSVTTILRVLDKPALNDWRVTQGVMAVMTSKQQPGEDLDAFVYRVLQVERVQDQESAIARDKGSEIHAALESYFLGQPISAELRPWIAPAADAIIQRGEMVTAEKILVGEGYAGKTDLILESPACFWVIDWKTSKKLPDPKKGAWTEHRVQAAAYAAAFGKTLAQVENPKPIRTANVYISSIEPGLFVVCEHDPDWQSVYNRAFSPLVTYWQWANSYKPQQ